MNDTNIFDTFNKADFAVFMEDFYDTEELCSITSFERAVSYVDQIFSIATITQKQDICFAYCGGCSSIDVSTLKEDNDNSVEVIGNLFDINPTLSLSVGKIGGAHIDIDRKLYDILQVADSYHDFPLGKNEYFVQNGINHFERWVDSMNLDLPQGITRKMLRNKNTLIKYLEKHQFLIYADLQQVHNPFYNVNLGDRFKLEKFMLPSTEGSNGMTFDEFYQVFDSNWYHPAAVKEVKWAFEYKDTTKHDIWNISGEVKNDYRARVLKLVQVAKICASIRATFGNTIKYCLDTTEPLVCLIFAVKLCGEALYNKIMKPTDGVKAGEFIKTLQLTDKQETWFNNLLSNSIQPEHEAYICDAHFLDSLSVPRNLNITLDRTPTGNVYTEGYPYQVELKGVTYDTEKKVDEAHVKITDNGVITDKFLKRDATFTSTSNVQGKLEILIPADLKNPTFGGTISQKRAGDWGASRKL